MYLHSESGDANADGVAQAMSQLLVIFSNYVPEDIYNKDEIVFFRAHLNKILAQGKVRGLKLQTCNTCSCC